MAPLPEEASSAAQVLQPKWKGISSCCPHCLLPNHIPHLPSDEQSSAQLLPLPSTQLDYNNFSGVTHRHPVLAEALVTTDKCQCLKY